MQGSSTLIPIPIPCALHEARSQATSRKRQAVPLVELFRQAAGPTYRVFLRDTARVYRTQLIEAWFGLLDSAINRITES